MCDHCRGCNCSRSNFLGCLLAARSGLHTLPTQWLERWLFLWQTQLFKIAFQGDRSSQPSPSHDKSSQDIGAIDDSPIDPLDKLRLSQTKTDWPNKTKLIWIFLLQKSFPFVLTSCPWIPFHVECWSCTDLRLHSILYTTDSTEADQVGDKLGCTHSPASTRADLQ